MSWFGRKRETRADSGLALPAGWLDDAFSTSSTASGQRVTVEKSLGLAPVWAAVSIISEQIGQLPLKVYRDLGDGERVEARQHRAWRLLHDKPNEITPAGRFWSTVTTHLLLWGNAFLLKRRDDLGLVEELWLLKPSEITIRWDANTRTKSFLYQPADGSAARDYSTDEVLHIFGLSLDGLAGESVISRCRNPIGAALARDEFEGTFYGRGAVLSGVVEMDGVVKSDEALKRFKASLLAIFGGSDKAHQIAVFENGAKFRQVGSPMKDLEFVASQNLSRTDIAVMFKLPPNFLGGSSGDGLTYATVEMNQAHFALHAIAPVTTVIAQALSQDPSIMPQSVHGCEFVLEGMLRGIAQDRAEFYKTLVDIKAMLPEEVRQRENLPALTDAQKAELSPAPPQLSLPGLGGGDLQSMAALAAANGNGGSADQTGGSNGS